MAFGDGRRLAVRGMRRLVLFAFFLVLAAAVAWADDSAAEKNPGRLPASVSRLLAELDSDQFEVRELAARRLGELIEKPEYGSLLAAEFQRQLVRADLSFEVRRRLTRWVRLLPLPPAKLPAEATPKELDALVRQVEADSYAARVGAVQRLGWLLTNPKLVCPVMDRIKRRLAEVQPGTEASCQLETVRQRARAAWLLGDPTSFELPVISDRQIGEWLDAIQTPAVVLRGSAEARRRCEAARCELMDVLARDEYVPRLKKAMDARLAARPPADAVARLKELLDWMKPELVAEFWRGGRQLGEQHLVVGVPTLSPNAPKPTHFDRADDRTAHYVSGNSLLPGDYPVGEAFPNPQYEQCFFHLVNLPTPRRRMAYSYAIRGTEAERLVAISRRTLDRVLAQKRSLNEPELVMLGELSAAEVSRFAGRYFLAIDDSPLAAIGPMRLGGRPSRFGLICARLADDGTKDAMPGLAEAIAKDRFLPPNGLGPYRLHWVAALSIAARDPWPGVDAWLAGQIGQRDLLMEPMPTAGMIRQQLSEDDDEDDSSPFAVASPNAEVGATAAALLLRRRHALPGEFGLQPIPDGVLRRLHLEGYRFAKEAARKKVAVWWANEQRKTAAPETKGR